MQRKSYQEHLDSYKETRPEDIKRAAARILANKSRYQEVETLTGVPWDFIGVIHLRESNLNFETHLHNGDTLARRTRRVPKGYPKTGTPPFTWVESAVDALKIKKLHERTDWSWEAMCLELERYNGMGYSYRKRPSPYLWAGTDQYVSGKFVADGKYNPRHVDTQLGVIPVLKKIRELETPVVVNRQEIVAASRKLTVLQRTRNAVVGTVSSVMAADWLGMLGQVKQFATDHAGLIIVGTAALAWGIFKLIEQYSIQDYKEGRYIPSGKSEEGEGE